MNRYLPQKEDIKELLKQELNRLVVIVKILKIGKQKPEIQVLKLLKK